MIDASDLISAVKGVTKEWTKQRKAEERGYRSARSRGDVYGAPVNFTDVAPSILPAAYQHASGGGQYPVAKRQLYYASRQKFLEAKGKEIKYAYFASLLTKFMNLNPDVTREWRVTADPRGTLSIPNTFAEVKIPCGTLQVDDHLDEASRNVALIGATDIPVEYPSLRAGERYQAVLYIEKEGFGPILEHAKIAERFGLAVLSNKGESVTAGRKFVDTVCHIGSVPLLTVHDLDKSGFGIAQNLTRVSDAAYAGERVTYMFENDINWIDLGLRLRDVEEFRLEAENCSFTGGFSDDTFCTPDEKAFLKSGRRVELNSFTSPQLIEWLETRLSEHLTERMLPPTETLEHAYRRAIAVSAMNDSISEAKAHALKAAEHAEIPVGLASRVDDLIKENGYPWDLAIYEIAKREPSGST